MATGTVQEKAQRRALGRGLSALIPGANGAGSGQKAGVLQLPIEEIERDERQPRQHIDEDRLGELAASIRSRGVIQPILVRRDGSRYRIIAGERRWRAAGLAGLKDVPVVVREASPKEAFELALIENIQREDLNPVEEAEAYKRLVDDHGLTQEAVAQRVGKERSTITNALRLLALPRDIKSALVDGSLNMGHARALLGLSDADAMRRAAAEVTGKGLNVRATEQLVRRLAGRGGPKDRKKDAQSPQVRSLIEQLQRALGTRARIVDSKGKGRIELEFYSYDDLDRILARLLPERR